MKQKIGIKPLSVNEAWQGRRFKTRKYKRFERDICLLLRSGTIPDGRLRLSMDVGMSSASCDVDNPVKPFIDCLQKRYGFDDKRIYELHVRTHKVAKGEEFIGFKLEPLKR